ncbi:MAG: type II toxin-antitoxin system RelE/ParE family toxin [Kiritimatiellia bacterium]
MDLRFLMEGQKFTLFAIMQGEDVGEYLAELEAKNTQAHDQIIRRLQQLAERGPSRKKDEFNDLGNHLYEAKARTGPRVIFFYDQNRIVICSHAFDKQGQKTPRKEIEKALIRRRSYLESKAAGNDFVIHTKEGHGNPGRQP